MPLAMPRYGRRRRGHSGVAYEVRDDYATVDENPQALADYLSSVLDMKVELYTAQSEGAMLEALRFGNADIAIMDGGAGLGPVGSNTAGCSRC